MHLDTIFNRAVLKYEKIIPIPGHLATLFQYFLASNWYYFLSQPSLSESAPPKMHKMRKSRGASSTFPLIKTVSWIWVIERVMCTLLHEKKCQNKSKTILSKRVCNHMN